ncbi:MAG: radical SAM protein [Candidatus Eiseniibacteriota bacterium]|jgi:putative pyruvate formate lyase activating enzyme
MDPGTSRHSGGETVTRIGSRRHGGAAPSGPPASYLALAASGELERRARAAVRTLASCTTCPRRCRVDRTASPPAPPAVCGVGRLARVASAAPHHGEEACLSGRRGSGTIFFASCNLRCVFCQNHAISQEPHAGARPVTARELAGMMLELQRRGCHNVNLVTPSHVVPQLLEAVAIAAANGLRLPLCYNTSAYDALDSLAWLDGVVDIYMPDLKLWSAARSRRYLKAADYPEVARQAIRAMHGQVGDLVLDRDGIARRGLLVRHLVMPDSAADSRAILEWLASAISPVTWVNVMGQYRPAHRAGRCPELAVAVEQAAVRALRAHAARLGLRLDR